MSAETLRDAAVQLRAWWPDCDCHAAERAVADWLDGLASRWSHDATGSEMDAAEAVARAYLGEPT